MPTVLAVSNTACLELACVNEQLVSNSPVDEAGVGAHEVVVGEGEVVERHAAARGGAVNVTATQSERRKRGKGDGECSDVEWRCM